MVHHGCYVPSIQGLFGYRHSNMAIYLQQQEIACQQVLLDDSSVFSIQWSVYSAEIAAGLTAEKVMNRYLSYIRSFTFSIVRPIVHETGIEFRLLNTNLSLISFLPYVVENGVLTLRICGGVLVQPGQCSRGQLRFEVANVEDGIKVGLELSDYCPLILGNSSPSYLRRLVYRVTQAAIHRLVTIRFLALLYRELAGKRALVRVVSVNTRDGLPT